MPFAKEFHYYRVGMDESVKAQASTSVDSEGGERTVYEQPNLGQEKGVYQEAYKRYNEMSIDQLAQHADDMGRMAGSTYYEEPPVNDDLIDHEEVDRIIANITKFTELGDATAQKLIDAGKAYIVANHLENFTKISWTHEELALKLIDAGAVDEVSVNLASFTDLGDATAQKMIDAGKGSLIADNLTSFTNLTWSHDDLVQKLIDAKEVKDKEEEEVPNEHHTSEAFSALKGLNEKAFRRAYAKKILRETELAGKGKKKWYGGKKEDPRRITEKERMFLVQDYISNAAESALSENFLKEYGFKDWADMMQKTGVSPEFVQSLARDEKGNDTMNFLDISATEMAEKGWWEKYGGKVVKGVASVVGAGIGIGVSAASGGTVPVLAALATSVAGLGGGQLGKSIAKYFSHDRRMQQAVGENGRTRGQQVAEQITREFLAQHAAAKGYFDSNTAKPSTETTKLGQMNGAMEGGKDGFNLLGKITQGFKQSAEAQLHAKDSKVKEYWDIAKRSNKIQFWSGLAGSVIAGGLAGFGTAKLQAAQQFYDQVAALRAEGIPIDLDSDGVSHMVKVFADGNGQETVNWMLKLDDVGRITETGGSLTTFATNPDQLASGVLGSSEHVFNPSNLEGLILPGDTTYVAAQALNMGDVLSHISSQSDKLFASVMQTAILTGTLTGGSAFAVAEGLDAVNARVTGTTSKKYQRQAELAANILGAQASDEKRNERRQTIEDQVVNGVPKTAEELEVEKKKLEEEEAAAKQKVVDEEVAAKQKVADEEAAALKKVEDEKLALRTRISDFEKLHGKNDARKGKQDFESIDKATIAWNNFHSAEGKVVLVDVERGGFTWDSFKTKVADFLHSQITAGNRLSLVLAVDGGKEGIWDIAAKTGGFNPADTDFRNRVMADLNTALQTTPAGHPRGFDALVDRFNIVSRGYAPTSPSPDLASWKGYLQDIATRDGIPDVASKITIHPDTIAP